MDNEKPSLVEVIQALQNQIDNLNKRVDTALQEAYEANVKVNEALGK
jgi:hypothetical protein